MSEKIITDNGKTEILRLGFASEQEGGAFKYLALGGNDSKASQDGIKDNFKEVSGYNYARVQTKAETPQDKTIKITGTFKEENYAPAEEGLITEIGLCNSQYMDKEEKFFLFSEVPPIGKTGDISLEYTIIISID